MHTPCAGLPEREPGVCVKGAPESEGGNQLAEQRFFPSLFRCRRAIASYPAQMRIRLNRTPNTAARQKARLREHRILEHFAHRNARRNAPGVQYEYGWTMKQGFRCYLLRQPWKAPLFREGEVTL